MHRAPSYAANDGLGGPVDVPRGGWRERVRSKPRLSQAYRASVFVTALLLIALGFALAVLPGPLTIPPVLIGLWIWSINSTAVTVGGLAAAVSSSMGDRPLPPHRQGTRSHRASKDADRSPCV
jgi:hypothetical protein